MRLNIEGVRAKDQLTVRELQFATDRLDPLKMIGHALLEETLSRLNLHRGRSGSRHGRRRRQMRRSRARR